MVCGYKTHIALPPLSYMAVAGSKAICVFGVVVYFFISSGALILYNKWLWVTWGFKYPVLSTSVHLFCSGAFGACCQLLNDGSLFGRGTPPKFLRRGVFLGLIISADLSLSTMSYLFLTIPFMEMIKSTTPIWTLLISLAARIEAPSCIILLSILLMALGLGLSAYGEADFNLTGFTMCLTASVLAACRLLLSHFLLREHFVGGAGEEDDLVGSVGASSRVTEEEEANQNFAYAKREANFSRQSALSLMAVTGSSASIFMLPVGMAHELPSLLRSKFASDWSLGMQASQFFCLYSCVCTRV